MRDRVSKGQTIGHVGQSGGVDRPQLHFEIRYAPSPRDRARPVDPTPLLP
jgi:murein DD-endopeptidase MepM/ murein hydrolase activator NlpD